MRRIERTSRFKRDYRRETKGKYRSTLERDIVRVVDALASNRPLAARHRDHALPDEFSDHRACYVRPNLVLIYSLPAAGTLRLVRLGSHRELGV